MLIDQPRLGVRRPEIAPEARMLAHGSYLILYQTHPDSEQGSIHSIEIVRIVHGRRDMSRIFCDTAPAPLTTRQSYS